MQFHVIDRGSFAPDEDKNAVYLRIDHWNDYSFVTSFEVIAFDEKGEKFNLPNIRVGFFGQTTEVATYQKLPKNFEQLSEEFFSLGMGVEFYKSLFSDFEIQWRQSFLEGVRDVVWDLSILEQVAEESVFQTSHLRSVTISEIKDQFVSVLRGEVLLTDFEFGFELPESEKFAGFDLTFAVGANSTPSTNMHALIGRNGVGKTTFLNSMVRAIADSEQTTAHFYRYTHFPFAGKHDLTEDYFHSLVSVAFSVFDPFDLPAEDEGGNYSYVGMTDYAGDDGAVIKSQAAILDEFVSALRFCFEDATRKNRWLTAMRALQSDENFAEMNLLSLGELEGDELDVKARRLFSKMSSGHSVVILTMTQLVVKVEERTLVLFDEPESHLHPPLLSAMIRSLSQLLRSRNAVAIIATHSPVVLQEIPRSCVWKVFRSRFASDKKRPDTETFGENVGTLTREVFGLEVERSGFHTVLAELVDRGGSYDAILEKLGGSLGNEAKGILRALVVNRDEGSNNDAQA